MALESGVTTRAAVDSSTADEKGLLPDKTVERWSSTDDAAGISKESTAKDAADQIKDESLDASGSGVAPGEKSKDTQLEGKDLKEDLSAPHGKGACDVVSSSPSRVQPEAVSLNYSNFGEKLRSVPLTPEELYTQIEQSRDKLFFIAYSVPSGSGDTPKKKEGDVKKKWYLVRVDLETCYDLEEAQNCKTSGRYYVEFYSKANSDQSKPDSQSRFWMIWNRFAYKRGEMVIGHATEFDPNHKSALRKRLVDLSKKRSSDDAKGDAEVVEFHPNLDRYTTWSDVVNLSDPYIRLVGPFDFEAVQPKHIDLEYFDPGNASLDDLYVRDRVPIPRWHELLVALEGRDIAMPSLEGKKRKRKSSIGERKHAKNQAACQLCGKVDIGDESLLFDNTPALSALCVHTSCGLQSTSVDKDSPSVPKIVSRKEIWALVDKTIAGVRQATSSDGEVYCVLEEFSAQLISDLNGIKTQMATPSKTLITQPINGSTIPRVFPESEFTPDEQQSFRVAFAHHVKADDPDGASEINAKIAKLDYDVEKRREKRIAREFADVSKKAFPHNVVPTKSRSDIKTSTSKAVETSNPPEKNQHSTKPGRGRPLKKKSPIELESAPPVKDSNSTKEFPTKTEATGSITLPKPEIMEKTPPRSPTQTGSVAQEEMNMSRPPTPLLDDPTGLSLVNQKIGVFARISAERRREKRRASSGSAPGDPPPNKVARASTHGETSSEGNTSNGDLPGNAEPSDAKTKNARPKTAFTIPKVYQGPLLNIPAEPVGATLNLPHIDGWTMRCIIRPTDNSRKPHVDRYFFSPGGRKFRSKPEVARFLECLAAAQGDEARAAIQFAQGDVVGNRADGNNVAT
ncbi:hypothetical protein HJC23_010105 [Cyclotella cryptica]|uniref:MBD domain-containing protein n=1 Tax=Cyclotella cryptica TaxID=29204 RepID=A0ABD3Q3Y8_9STRA|eukprot:CCRYP_009102-RA/>CCRYP_009102-RA protein AED:0.16 eAED:0.16 QI:345/1/1/1/0.5/0.4/5/3476/851